MAIRGKTVKAWEPKRKKRVDWRTFLTAEEAIVIAKTDEKLGLIASLRLDVKRSDRSLIINRAIHRARFAHPKE